MFQAPMDLNWHWSTSGQSYIYERRLLCLLRGCILRRALTSRVPCKCQRRTSHSLRLGTQELPGSPMAHSFRQQRAVAGTSLESARPRAEGAGNTSKVRVHRKHRHLHKHLLVLGQEAHKRSLSDDNPDFQCSHCCQRRRHQSRSPLRILRPNCIFRSYIPRRYYTLRQQRLAAHTFHMSSYPRNTRLLRTRHPPHIPHR